MTALSSLSPILLSLSYLGFVFHLPYLRNWKFRFFLPLKISFFTFLIFGEFILSVFLPDKIFFSFIPNSFLGFFLRILISNHLIDFVCFYFRKIVKLCSYTWIFYIWNVLRRIFKVLLTWFLCFICQLYLDSID
jgi:hypothetical protein